MKRLYIYSLLSAAALTGFAPAAMAEDAAEGTPEVVVPGEEGDVENPVIPDEDLEETPAIDWVARLSEINLPLVVVETEDGEEPSSDYLAAPPGQWGETITNATKVPARLTISLLGEQLLDTKEYVKGESGLTIKHRGNTSAKGEKKSFKLKLQKKTDLLQRGDDSKYKDKNWVLLQSGHSMSTKYGFWLGEIAAQPWTPAHQYVNLIINGTYRGIYILAEGIEQNQKCRIDVDDDLGYIVEADAYWWKEDWSFPSLLTAPQIKFTYKYPDPDDLDDEWHQSIAADMEAMERTILDGTYDQTIDVDSFAKWIVQWDILGGKDAAGANPYIVRRDRETPFAMGPLWDFDGMKYILDDWSAVHKDFFYFHHLFNSENEAFSHAYSKMWQLMGPSSIDALIDRIQEHATSEEAQALDASRAITIEDDIFKNEILSGNNVGKVSDVASDMILWLEKRKEWLSANIAEYVDPLPPAAVDTIDAATEGDGEPVIYDMLGRRLGADAKGLLIVNGKKVVVK